MANQGAIRMVPGMPVPNHPAAVQGWRNRLEAPRALLLCGAAATMWTTVGNPDADDATQAFLGLVTWLLGVCLLSLVPVAGRFPQADAFAGAAIANANAVFRHIMFTPWN